MTSPRKSAAAAPEHAGHAHPATPRATAERGRLAKRINRIEGQVRGIGRMVEDDRYCIDILTQLQAVRAALSRVETEILKEHLGHCIEGAIVSGDKAEQRKKAEELITLLERAR